MGSRKSILIQVLSAIFSPKPGSGPWALSLAFLTVVCVGLLPNTIAPLLEELVTRAFGLKESNTSIIRFDVFALSLLLIAILAFAWYFYIRHDEKSRFGATVDPLKPVEPFRGLIAAISLPNPHFRPILEEVAPFVTSPVGPSEAVRERILSKVYATNWGPLAAAVELHSPRLEHVWLIRSPQITDADYELLGQILRAVAGKELQVKAVPIQDASDVHGVQQRVRSLYESELHPLQDFQVIADITSATVPVSAGIVLSTLDETRNVQYLKQNARELLITEEGQPRTREQLKTLFRYVRTSPSDVGQAFLSYMNARGKQ